MPTLSNAFDDLIYAASEQYGVPFTWIKAVIGTESDFNPNAYRAEPQINDASRGLMQILLRTAKGYGFSGPESGLFDPETNIGVGTRFLEDLISKYGLDFSAVYSAYNSGSPTAYKTNSSVAQHVNRALGYLQAAEDSTVFVTAEDPGESGFASGEISSIGIIALAIGALVFFIKKG